MELMLRYSAAGVAFRILMLVLLTCFLYKMITNSIHFYSLSHDAACGRVWFVAQSAKMSAGNY
jgi:hypothetical protein